MLAKPLSNRKFHDPRKLVGQAVVEGGATVSHRTFTIDLPELPLSWRHARVHLSNRQMLAGETLREDYESAALGPHVTMLWENMPRS